MIRLELTWPPSTNRTWRHARGRTYLPKEVKLFRASVYSIVLAEKARCQLVGLPLCGDLEAIITLHPPDKRRRDEDNFAGKALFDALTLAGVWGDDSQIRRKIVEWGGIIKDGKVVVEIKSMEKK